MVFHKLLKLFDRKSKGNIESKKCLITIILCAFESSRSRLSNAQKSTTFKHFFDLLFDFDFTSCNS